MLKLPQLSAIEQLTNSTKPEIHAMMKYLLSFFLCFGCVSQQSNKQNLQGVYGIVTEITGNQMPSPDLPQVTAQGKTLAATIHFYPPIDIASLQLNEHGLYKPINALQPIARCIADQSGKFRQALPAGRYSIIVALKDGWFAHQSDGTTVQPLLIDSSKWTEKNIQINYRAAY